MKKTGNFLWYFLFVITHSAFFGLLDAKQYNNQNATHQQSKKLTVDVTVTVDRQMVVPGERVCYTVCIVHDPQSTEITRIIPPDFKEVYTEKMVGPVKSVTFIDGIRCMVYEFTGFFYPVKEGPFYIPEVAVEYQKHESLRKNNFHNGRGFFAQFTQSSTVTIKKNGPRIIVEPTIFYQGQKVSLVGCFTESFLSLDKKEFSNNEAALLSYTIMGCGNLHDCKPSLFVPEGLECYFSEMRCIENGAVFEYVLRASRPGTYSIASQNLVYFDSNDRVCKQLTTEPIVCVVTGSDQIAVHDDLAREHEVSTQFEDCATESVFPVIVERSLLRTIRISESLFLFIIMIFMGYFLILLISPALARVFFYIKRWYVRKNMVRSIKYLLQGPFDHATIVMIYEIFKKLQNSIDWHQHGDIHQQWKIFWDSMVMARFSETMDCVSEVELKKNINYWIAFFNKTLV